MSGREGRSAVLRLAIPLSMCAVFALGLLTPLGVADWVLYLVPVALTLLGTQAAAPILVAAASTAAMALGFFHSPGAEFVTPTVALLNRGFGTVSIWAVAAVARQVIVSRRRLAEQDWVRSGQRDLGLCTQGDQAHDALADSVLRFLCEYLEAPVGALYLVEGDELRRVAGYALGDGAPGATLAAGEGLLGQAVRSKKLLRFDGLAGDHLPITSALGRSRPREVLALPALLDGEPFAAIELGFVRRLAEPDLDLLSSVAEPIAVALRSSRDRGRLVELLRRTQEQAEELQAQQEELKVANEELETQSRSLREAQARLEEQQAELEQTNTQLAEQSQSIERQRDELVRSQEDLVARSDELSRASRYKSEFLATMSHELRTPLNSALILAKLLADNRDGNLTADQVKFASTIYASGNDLLTLINDILDLSRIEAGRMDLSVEPVPIARTLTALERTFQPIAAEKKLAFEVLRQAGTPETVTADPTRLQQILRNLLSNAFKFTDTGAVRLRVYPTGSGELAFEVTDTGEGIPRDKQELVFEAFRQADGTTQRRHGGTGLGLTISRELARRLGGEIRLVSEPGKGSTFTLLLPTTPLATAPAPRAVTISTSATLPSAPPPQPALVRAPPRPTPPVAQVPDDRAAIASGDRTVLVVEDDATFAALLRDLVREQRFRCVVASSAAEGLALAAQFTPAAVLLDIALPDTSGFSVLEALKTNSATRHIPIHVISGSDYTRQALELGAVGYIVKPARREQLVDALRKLEQRLERKVRRVLVVEDAPVQRESLVALLGADDVEIVPVGTSAEALGELKRGTFDCMVLDLNLAGESGFDLLDQMALGETFSSPRSSSTRGARSAGTRSCASAATRARSSSRGRARPSACSTRSRCSCTRSRRSCRPTSSASCASRAAARRSSRGARSWSRRTTSVTCSR